MNARRVHKQKRAFIAKNARVHKKNVRVHKKNMRVPAKKSRVHSTVIARSSDARSLQGPALGACGRAGRCESRSRYALPSPPTVIHRSTLTPPPNPCEDLFQTSNLTPTHYLDPFQIFGKLDRDLIAPGNSYSDGCLR